MEAQKSGFIYTALTILIPVILAILTLKFLRKWRHGVRDRKYHPIAGTMVHQLLNFQRLHHYMTDLAAKYKTYRLLTPFRNEVYTSDPANVEYILKTNFENYGKVCALTSTLIGFCNLFLRV
uniref:Abieta-7,13-dien-18-ol hydroxylase n=1 Tax=Opuntia streptacantha TaxID=393608 RepID=A0A7C9CEN8_OPUST